MKTTLIIFLLCLPNLSFAQTHFRHRQKQPVVTIAKGTIQGISDSGVYIFKGIPFAQPPVDNLRWKPPRPPKAWQDTLPADHFGTGCMQRPIFGDMNFRFPKKSEDCLYLNVWTPVKPSEMEEKHLPVLVYFYGGGFLAGDGSEYRYDGENMARTQGIVMVTANYRLNVFGFLATPELTKESPHHASGNYGLLDQVQVLRWVKKNIEAFGGDPNKVTIAGESAGSMSVNGLMASPLSRNLFRGAVGESGGLFGPLAPMSLSEAEKRGAQFVKMAGAHSLADLRSMSAEKLLKTTGKKSAPRLRPDIDGYFLPKQPVKIFAKGKQAHVPLLLGWNSEESSWMAFLKGENPTRRNFIRRVKQVYGKDAKRILELFLHSNEKQVKQSATRLAGDRFTVFSTWKWAELQSNTGGHPVYRYYFTRPRPAKENNPQAYGAVHSAEIEYVLGNLQTNRVYNWQPVDYKISRIFMGFVSNFVKTGNPNGLGLPKWIPVNQGKSHYVMQIGAHTFLRPSNQRKQLLYLDKLYYPEQ